eukprot:g17525.t1
MWVPMAIPLVCRKWEELKEKLLRSSVKWIRVSVDRGLVGPAGEEEVGLDVHSEDEVLGARESEVLEEVEGVVGGGLYIGETKQRLGDHFLEHLHSVHNKRQHLLVANHFNSPSHALGDMSILDILQCHNDATRKLEEQHLVFCLGTLQPNGL